MWRRVVVVVPCFNERSRLRLDLFQEFAEEHPQVGFLFVNDGSTDGTGEMILEAARSRPEDFRAHSLPDNRGKAEAVRLGLQEAVSFEAEVAGYWDADLATPLAELGGMLAHLDSAPELQGVLGSRVRLLGRAIHRRSSRHYLGRLFATLASLALGMAVYDTQCGAKVFVVTKELAEALKTPFKSRWIFDVELLGRLNRVRGPGVQVALREYPVETWNDVGGSKIRARDFLKAGFDLLSLWRGLARGREGRAELE